MRMNVYPACPGSRLLRHIQGAQVLHAQLHKESPYLVCSMVQEKMTHIFTAWNHSAIRISSDVLFNLDNITAFGYTV